MKTKYSLFFLIVFLASLMLYTYIFADDLVEGKIIFMKGTVLLNGKAAKKGDPVKLKDILETKAASICIFKIGGKNVFKMKANAKLEYNVTGKSGSNINLQKGFMAAVIKKKNLLAGDEFKINAPTLVAGVRGTSFAIKVENEKQVYFCTCNGIIRFQDKNGKQGHQITNASHGAERFIEENDGSIKIKKYGLEFHNNDSIEDLALEIDEEIDWSKP